MGLQRVPRGDIANAYSGSSFPKVSVFTHEGRLHTNGGCAFSKSVHAEVRGYGNNRRKLVAVFERGDLITIREHGRRTKDTARIVDVLWWMKRSKAAKIQMEKLRERKAAKAARLAARRQRAATRRLFSQ